MTYRLLIAVAVMSALLPATAHAVTVPEAIQIADRQWPNSPCAGQLQAMFEPSVQARGHDDETSPGWHCTIYLAPALTRDPGRLCDVIVHGAGHYSGIWAHTPTGIMGPNSWPVDECHPPPTLRQQVRDLLPAPRAAWVIRCRSGRCAAKSGRAKRVRRFTVAGTFPGYTITERSTTKRRDHHALQLRPR